MELDLDLPQFTLAEAVRIVPGLTIDMVQNWDKRKVLSEETAARAKKNAQLKWSIRSLIVMRILTDAGRYGFKPSRCVVLARFISRQADQFLQDNEFGGSRRNGVPQYLFSAKAIENYRRCVVRPNSDETFSAEFLRLGTPADDAFRIRNFCGAYLIVEVDLITADTINNAAYVAAGFDPQTRDDATSRIGG